MQSTPPLLLVVKLPHKRPKSQRGRPVWTPQLDELLLDAVADATVELKSAASSASGSAFTTPTPHSNASSTSGAVPPLRLSSAMTRIDWHYVARRLASHCSFQVVDMINRFALLKLGINKQHATDSSSAEKSKPPTHTHSASFHVDNAAQREPLELSSVSRLRSDGEDTIDGMDGLVGQIPFDIDLDALSDGSSLTESQLVAALVSMEDD